MRQRNDISQCCCSQTGNTEIVIKSHCQKTFSHESSSKYTHSWSDTHVNQSNLWREHWMKVPLRFHRLLKYQNLSHKFLFNWRTCFMLVRHIWPKVHLKHGLDSLHNTHILKLHNSVFFFSLATSFPLVIVDKLFIKDYMVIPHSFPVKLDMLLLWFWSRPRVCLRWSLVVGRQLLCVV